MTITKSVIKGVQRKLGKCAMSKDRTGKLRPQYVPFYRDLLEVLKG